MAAVAITQAANPAGVVTDGGNATGYGGIAIGTASPDRITVVVIGKEVATITVNNVVISGVTMSLIGSTTFGNMGAWIYFASYPTGTTANIAVFWSGAATAAQTHIAVYAVTGAAGPPNSSGSNTSTDMDATAPLTTGSTTIPTNGGMLAIAVGATDTVVKTWANLTADIDADAGDFRFTTAKSTTAGTATRTCTGTTDLEDGALVWAIFAESVLPPGAVMPPYVPASRPR